MHVYTIVCKDNGKWYVGQHSGADLEAYLDLQCRRAHSARRNDKPLLYRAIRKHGADAFLIKSLVTTDDKVQLNELERFFIRVMGSRLPDIGYNLAEGDTGGATRSGCKNSLHQNEAIRAALTNRPKSAEHRKHLSEDSLLPL